MIYYILINNINFQRQSYQQINIIKEVIEQQIYQKIIFTLNTIENHQTNYNKQEDLINVSQADRIRWIYDHTKQLIQSDKGLQLNIIQFGRIENAFYMCLTSGNIRQNQIQINQEKTNKEIIVKMDRINVEKNDCGVCKDHQRPLIYLCTDPTQSKTMKCVSCIVADKVQPDYLIPIAEIIESNKKTVFQNWPLQNDNQEILEIKKISNKPPTDLEVKEKIYVYFKELKMSTDSMIEKLKTEMLMKAQDLWNFNDKILALYNQLSFKEDIKNYIEDSSLSFEQKNVKLKEIIIQTANNQKLNKEKFKRSLEHLKVQEKAIEFDNPKQIMKEVLEKMGKINFFLIEDVNELLNMNETPEFLTKLDNPLKNQFQEMNEFDFGEMRPNNEYLPNLDNLKKGDLNQNMDSTKILRQNKEQQVKIEEVNDIDSGTNQVEIIMKLVRNKFNYCSDEYLEKLEAHLKKHKNIINLMKVGQIHHNKFELPNLDILDGDEVKDMTKIARQLLLRKETFGKLQHCDNEVQLKTETIMKLVRNRTNFCDDGFLNQLEEILTGVEKYLNSFQVGNIQKYGRQHINCNSLSDEQINNIGKLAEKMNELTNNHGNNYTNSIQPRHEIQQSSYIISKGIQSNKNYSLIEHHQINQLLINYPIFETIDLTPPPRINIQMNFIKSKYQESQKLQLVGDHNGCDITHLSKTNYYQTAASDLLLDANLVYVIRCTFNKPYETGNIRIGLTQDINKNIPNENGDGGFRSGSESSILIIKGEHLSSAKLKKTITSLEFRVCVRTRQLYFADYPNYANINKANELKIDPILPQMFGIGFHNVNENFSVRFDHFQVMFDKGLIGIFE